MHRGEIWWAELPVPRKSEPGYRRPVLIIQIDELNGSRIQTAVTISITSNLRRAQAPGNVFLSKHESGLSKDSVVNVSQVATLNKSMLTHCAGALNHRLMEKVAAGLRLVLGL